MSHTPGPWRYEVPALNRGTATIELYGDCDSGPDEQYMGELDVNEETAKLIVASQDLLSCLENCVEQMEIAWRANLRQNEGDEWPALCRAKIAIKKATSP